MSLEKEFDREVDRLAYRHERWRVFGDFCESAALSIAQAATRTDERERRYLEIVKRYDAEELQSLCRMLALVVAGLYDESGACDFLGVAFQRLDLASHWHGQFFTPMELSRMIAMMTLDPEFVKAQIAEKGFLLAQEPACGSGGMVLALADAMRASGFNPQCQLRVDAIDIAPVCAHMAYVQLSLAGIPARVFRGNTLSLEMGECWVTPALGWAA